MKFGRQTKECSKCLKKLPRSAYAADDQWYANSEERKCRTCRNEKGTRGMWTCIKCKDMQPKGNYSRWLEGRAVKTKDRTSRCNDCFVQEEEEKEDMRKKSLAQVVKP